MTSETTLPESLRDPVALRMGRRLSRRRQDLRLSRRWLASVMGRPDQELRAWEEGTSLMDAKALHALASLLDVPMSYFMEDLEPPPRPRRLERALREHRTRTLLRAALTPSAT